MAQPGLQAYLDASSFAYTSGEPAGVPAGFSGPFTVTTAHQLNGWDAFDEAAGFYAAAYTLNVKGKQDVVIAFEGTNLAGYKNDPIFSTAEIRDDVEIAEGKIPTALDEAAAFTQDVLSAAKSAGIPASRVFLTGHSLGGAEAEYADANTQVNGTKLKGTTFGAPGISSSDLAPGTTSGLTDYVDYGDPVGNYAHTTTHTSDGRFIYSDSIVHYGNTVYTGRPDYATGPNGIVQAGALWGAGVDAEASRDPIAKAGGVLDKAKALGDFLNDAGSYHLLNHYAADLGHQLTAPPPGVTTFDAANAFNIIGGVIRSQNA